MSGQLGENLGEIARQHCSNGLYEAYSLCSSMIKPIEAIHGELWL